MGYREDWFNNAIPLMGKYRCQHCGGWFSKSQMEVDHIIPQKHGGSDNLVNLQGLCKTCNRSKGAKTNKTVGDLSMNVVKVGAKKLIKGLLK